MASGEASRFSHCSTICFCLLFLYVLFLWSNSMSPLCSGGRKDSGSVARGKTDTDSRITNPPLLGGRLRNNNLLYGEPPEVFSP